MRQHILQQLLSVRTGEPFALRNLRLPQGTVTTTSLPQVGDGLLGADMVIADGRIDWLGPPASRDDLPNGIDRARALAWPGPVDCHTHLDKALVWQRSPNADGTFDGASSSASRDAAVYHSTDDIRQRVDFALSTAFAHGTTAIRSHVDSGRSSFDLAFATLCELADDWRDRITLQVCPFVGLDEDLDWIREVAERACHDHAGILSVFVPANPELDRALDDVMAIAGRYGLRLDFHADEILDPASRGLDAIARAVLRNGFDRPVLVGHCCALSVQPPPTLERTLERVARAGIGVVSLPLCNAYLMDRRAGETPRYRGCAPVHEMRKHGIPVAIASDNVRDAFYAYGDLDVPELFRDAVRMMQLDHPLGDWAMAVTTTAADLMGLAGRGMLEPGAPADLILFTARNWSEFISRPLSDRIVLRDGHPIDATPPDFRHLDDMEGMRI